MVDLETSKQPVNLNLGRLRSIQTWLSFEKLEHITLRSEFFIFNYLKVES